MGTKWAPQKSVQLTVVPCDAAMETTPTISELCLLGCPDNAGFQLELLSVSFRANTLPVDGTNDVHMDLEFIDDSDSDGVTTLVTAYDLEDDTTVLIMNEVYRGSQIMDPGDVINVEFDVTDPDTASEGAAFVVEFQVLEHS